MRSLKLAKKSYPIFKKPIPHCVVPTKKELHGWYPGKRECTSERLLINPYNGCSVGCFYCYTRALPGYFEVFHKQNIIFVAKDFDKRVGEELDSLNVVSCGYLSPVTDPFQELENIYKLSQKITEEFVKRNIPIEFITKCKIPQKIIELIKEQKHSFIQVSILTPNDKLRKIFSPLGADTQILFDNLKRASREGIHTVLRIDPIFPFITDKKADLETLIKMAVDCGTRHIVASILDIPLKIYNWVLFYIKKKFGDEIYSSYQKLYCERIGYLNARIDYRKTTFEFLRKTADKNKVSFALCMEYELKEDKILGLNREFMSSLNCEGIDIPIYIRKGNKFLPWGNCPGNCLNCKDALCGIEELAMAKKPDSKKAFTLKDYKRWSQIYFKF